MDQYINQTQTLYDSGARRFLFLTVPPIELSPSVQAGGPDNVKAEGAAVKQYNDALKARVAKFAAANPQAKTYVVDTTVPFMKAIDNPKAYGADNATCFDESGTKCLWWNDVSLDPGATGTVCTMSIAEADCHSTILALPYTSSWLKRFQRH
jgi:phospholipase/lecithinase/hemolysin